MTINFRRPFYKVAGGEVKSFFFGSQPWWALAIDDTRQEGGWDDAVVCRQGSSRIGRQSHLVQLGLGQPLGLGPSVLEPDFDLGFAELQLFGELGPLGDGQILLLLELVLK